MKNTPFSTHQIVKQLPGEIRVEANKLAKELGLRPIYSVCKTFRGEARKTSRPDKNDVILTADIGNFSIFQHDLHGLVLAVKIES